MCMKNMSEKRNYRVNSSTTLEGEGVGGGVILTPPDKARRYCFTLNNYTDEEFLHITQNFEKRRSFEFLIGREIGERCGTPHLQGFISAKNAVPFDSLKKLMPRAHIAKCKGSRQENIGYCSKDGDYTTNIDTSEVEALRDIYLDKLKNLKKRKPKYKSFEQAAIALNKRDRNEAFEASMNDPILRMLYGDMLRDTAL